MTSSTMLQHMPLSAAYLCQDCNSVGNCSSHCPACASGALLALSTVLDRKPAAHLVADQHAFAAHIEIVRHVAAAA